ncbi:hypothetical protein LCGC14_0926630 [marine sediment metagenome]|uniref:Uncharacterized protein n=1 Tax=marine sediment metagenome TaxID=412755 RepID=A0A0F9R7X1_9ZZZZ
MQRWRLHVNLNGKVPNAQTTIFHIKDDNGQWVKFDDVEEWIRKAIEELEKHGCCKHQVDVLKALLKRVE